METGIAGDGGAFVPPFEPNKMTKILLAEDDTDMRRFLVKALQTAGYEVISYDNGGVNRYRSEVQVLREMQRFVDSRPYNAELKAIDDWLGTLTEGQMETVCAGEMSEADAILVAAPAFTETLLHEYFEEVC